MSRSTEGVLLEMIGGNQQDENPFSELSAVNTPLVSISGGK